KWPASHIIRLTGSERWTRSHSIGEAISGITISVGNGRPLCGTRALCYARRLIGMSRLVLLTDRSPERVLPGAAALGLDLKVEPLSPDALGRLPDLEPEALLVDGAEDPATAFALLEVLAATDSAIPRIAV